MIAGSTADAHVADAGRWRIPLRVPPLLRRDVHLWRIDLAACDERQTGAWLAPDEHARAVRIRVSGARRQFVVTRAALRLILAHYLDESPAHLAFNVNAWGKLELPSDTAGLHFNVSHAGDWSLIAVARCRRVGVDIERIRDGTAKECIAEHFFAAAEVADLQRLPADQRNEAFFHCWTRKEAFIKAVGRGLSMPLDDFAVTVCGPAVLREVRSRPAEAARWMLQALYPAPGYVGALAVEGAGWRLRSWQLPDFFPAVSSVTGDLRRTDH